MSDPLEHPESLRALLDHLSEGTPREPSRWNEWQIAPIGGGHNNLLYHATGQHGDLAVKFTMRDDWDRAGGEYRALRALQEAGLDLALRGELASPNGGQRRNVREACASGTRVNWTTRRPDILRGAQLHGARNVRIFGSVARGEARPDSDVDLLVDVEPGRSLLDLGALLVDLEILLNCKVDVVTEPGLRPRIRQRVMQQAVPL